MSNVTLDTTQVWPVTTSRVHQLEFHGTGGAFFLIFLKNVFLTMITLGIYLAWAKTERRQYIWGNTSFHGQNFRYTGTGKELFKGYVIVAGAYAVFVGLPALVNMASETAAAILRGAIAIGFVLIAPILIFRSRAFLYSRTAWRSIRFGLAPTSVQYAKTFLSGILLTVVTLGLYYPILGNRLYKIMTDSTRFGSLEFRYDGSDREVFWMTVKGWLLTLVTFGIYYFWHSARLSRYRLAHTYVGDQAVLRSELTGVDLYVLMLLNVFGTTLTLGLAFPWITMYSLRRIARRIHVEGVIDFESIEQRTREEGAVADGFADAFDLDLGF